MKNLLTEIIESESIQEEKITTEDIQVEAIQGVRVGKLISLEQTGHIYIDYPDNRFGPLPARSCIRITEWDCERQILLMFENGDPQKPIIIGMIKDKPVLKTHDEQLVLNKEKLKDIQLDGERIIFDAKKEIVLRCGEGSVTIKTDGRIIIKGTNLLSRSKGLNRIRGAAVNIN